MILFSVTNLTHRFGGLRAVAGFNLQMKAGELVGLIGPNGAGKTTVFNLVSGIYRPTAGRIEFANFDVTGLPPHEISRLGVARTFQNIRLFHDMTVIDNVKVACRAHVEYGLLASLLHPPSFWRAEHRLDEYCYNLLRTLGLEARAGDRAAALPYGQQRRLEIARALATAPKLLLLDEPAAGMNPQETAALIETIGQVRREFGLTILLIEHNMQVIMRVSERILVMDFGETIAEGLPAEIRAHPRVVEAYLDKGGRHAA